MISDEPKSTIYWLSRTGGLWTSLQQSLRLRRRQALGPCQPVVWRIGESVWPESSAPFTAVHRQTCVRWLWK